MKRFLLDRPRLDRLAADFLRKYGDGRSEAYDDLRQLLASERERAMQDVVADVCAFFRMPDEEFDRTHAAETRIAHATAATIEGRYLRGSRISRLLEWDSTANPIPADMGRPTATKASP